MAYTALSTNSSHVALSYGHSFEGSWVNVLSYLSLQIVVNTDRSGVLYIDSSLDGVTVDNTESYNYDTVSEDKVVRYVIRRQYVRVRFTNTQQAGLHQTQFSLQTLGSSTLLL